MAINDNSSIKSRFKSMALAQVVSQMTVLVCLMIDSIMIGRFLGVDSMTAYGLSNPLLLAFAAVGSMLSAGSQVLCSRTIGNGDKKGTNACFSMAVAIAAVVSILGVIATIVFRSPLSTLLGAGTEGVIFDLTSDYMLGFIIGAPAFLFSTVLVPYMQLANQQMRLVAAVAFMMVADVILDLINVFVVNGGMLGMGLASSISYYMACIVGVGFFLKKDCPFKFSAKLVDWKECKEMLKAGIPTIINMLSTVLLAFTMNKILLEVSGNLAVAAYSVIGTIVNICYAFSGGLAGVTLMLTGIYYSSNDRDSLRKLLRISLHYAILVDLIVMVVVLLIAPFIVKIFLADNVEAVEMASVGSRIFVVSLVISAINSAFKHFYQGTGRLTLTCVLSALQNYVCPAVAAFLLGMFAGLSGVWYCFLVGEVAVLLIIFIIVVINKKRVKFDVDTFSLMEEESK